MFRRGLTLSSLERLDLARSLFIRYPYKVPASMNFGRPPGRVGGCPPEVDVPVRKILVVDDSKLIHKMFTVMLRQYEVVHAMDGREGLVAATQNPDTDLILLDINMPNMNGIEFLTTIKADSALAPIPVVVVSTEGKEEDTQRALDAGASAYIKKPFDHSQLIEVLARF